MAWCLVPSVADKFKQDIISGKVDPFQLAEMTSAKRRDFFAERLGEENAEQVNRLFESKLILKDRQQGMITWAKQVSGMSPDAKRDIISRIERMDSVLDAPAQDAFLEDLAAWKLGTRVSYDEAKTINGMADRVRTTEAEMKEGGDRLEYGRSVVALRNYVDGLKHAANKMTLEDVRQHPVQAVKRLGMGIASNSKAIQASMDNSAIFRQGWRTLWTHPQIWKTNAIKSFQHLVKYKGQHEVMDELNADIVSRPTYDLMQKAKLDVGVNEETFPTTLPEKLPILGKVYKATENAYTAFVRKSRADIFDKYIEIAKDTGVELTDTELQSIGKMVNSLTGRGHLGHLEPAAAAVNSIFFSPKFLKSHIDILTQPLTGAGGSSFVRKQAAMNLVKVIGGTAAILTVANAIRPGSVEKDPRSADFGQIKIGDTRFDVTGGMRSIVTLAARLATMSSKSSTTGKVKPLNEANAAGRLKFNAHTGEDVVVDFLGNKLSPVGNVVKDFLKGETPDHKPVTVKGEAIGLVTPLPVKTGIELWQNPNSANFLAGMIADALGISTNTYSPNIPKSPKIPQ